MSDVQRCAVLNWCVCVIRSLTDRRWEPLSLVHQFQRNVRCVQVRRCYQLFCKLTAVTFCSGTLLVATCWQWRAIKACCSGLSPSLVCLAMREQRQFTVSAFQDLRLRWECGKQLGPAGCARTAMRLCVVACWFHLLIIATWQQVRTASFSPCGRFLVTTAESQSAFIVWDVAKAASGQGASSAKHRASFTTACTCLQARQRCVRLVLRRHSCAGHRAGTSSSAALLVSAAAC